MNNWFECKIKYEKVDEKGKSRKVSELYLVDALTFSEAEARISKLIAPYISGEFSIVGMKKAGINEIFPNEEGDRWYKCKMSFISIDEVNAVEKKINTNVLVLGSSVNDGLANLDKAMKDSMADYEVTSIAVTQIMDIFPYTVEETEAKDKVEE